MDKRGYIELETSPNTINGHNGAIKKKVRITKSISFENSRNILNCNIVPSYPGYNLSDLDFDDIDDLDLKRHEDNSLDLSDFKRCRVNYIEVNRRTYEKILHVQEKKTQRTAKCCLKGVWFETEVSQGDVVSVKGIFNEDRKMFMLSNDNGMIVTHPDRLISGTSVVGSLFCTRKAVLSERFKSVDSASSKIMNIGSIVHEIIQKALKEELTSMKEIKRAAQSVLCEADMIQLLYSSEMSMKELENEIEPFLAKIFEFMQENIVGSEATKCVIPLPGGNKSFEGRIVEVKDIEENVWSPRLGMKGKVDATVAINPPGSTFRKTVPLEIKTGRASFSFEHKGQLIIYQMMLKDMGKQIDSGLLLYIKENIMSEFKAAQSDENGLISLRNRFAKYMELKIVERDKTINLPEPINHHSACEKCPYNVLCCAFQKKDTNSLLPVSHPLYRLSQQNIAHLTDSHLSYFLHWCHLITLEHNEAQRSNKIKHLWTKSPEHRASKGNALIYLHICDLVMPENGEFLHHFTSSNGTDFSTLSFKVGDYLIVSTDTRIFITAGRVAKIEPSIITMSLPKDLSRQYQNEKFHLDKYESQSQSVFNFSNVGILLENEDDKGINKLRRIIIDKEPAKFTSTLPKSSQETIDKILAGMNHVQRLAIIKALTCENYMLIKGLPGTGKSQTLVNLIHILTSMKKSILITSHTNSAVDNILLRLKERGIKFLRLGSNARINPSLKEFSEATVTESCKSLEDLEKVYGSYQVVACTCLGATHPLLSRKRFDYCLVDEATQIYQPTVIRPLLSANKFILVGDPEQLSPLVRSSDARVLGGNESLFERLDCVASTFVLGLQYRMNQTITKLANNLTYNGQLKCANDVIGKAKMEVPNAFLLRNILVKEVWLAKVLSHHLDQACVLVNTGDVYELASSFMDSINEERPEKSKLYVNYCEIAIVLRYVEILLECGVEGKSIGIIAPYRDQVEALKKVFASYHTVEVNTVDQYQGRDKKIIIYSCTLSTNSDAAKQASEVEILEDRRRLTVAITRAKHKLIMIGDVNCLNKYTPFRDLFKHMNAMSKVQVYDERFGFSWQNLMAHLKSKLEKL